MLSPMFKNYLTLAIRSILHNKFYSIINVIGFAIGISACILILLWVVDELGYDTFHSKSDRIYRILAGEDNRFQPRTPHPLAQQMVIDFPEVEAAVTMSPLWGPGLTRAEYTVRYEDISYDEKGIFSVDTTFFRVFDFPFLEGNPETALNEPMCLILTRETALKYFGTVGNAMGKTLRINNEAEFTVNGVIENVPNNSHFTFDFLISYVSMKQIDRQMHNGQLGPYYTWEDFGHYNYLVIHEGADPQLLEKKLNDWILVQNFIPLNEKDIQRIKDGSFRFVLQPMKDIHLRSNIIWELGTNGNILYVYIFFTVALLILIIACVNFMNLSTARSLKRAKEVGVRKTLGVQRRQLVIQFLSESVLLTAIATLLAILLVELLLPVFNNLIGKDLSLQTLLNFRSIWILVVGTLLVSLFAGSYPAFYLSSFIPYEVLKGRINTGSVQLNIRKALVIFQFTISIFLIICTFIIYRQISFLRNRDLGFNQDQVVVIPMKDDAVRLQYDVIRSAMLANPGILQVAAASSIPGGQFNQNPVRADGNNEDKPVMETFVSPEYFDLLELKTISGRSFSNDFKGDTTSSFVINETAARLLDLENPVDRSISYFGDIYTNARGKIIGVVKDFNIHSLQQPVEPLIILLGRKSYFTYMLLKINTENIPGTMAYIGETWRKFDNNHTFTCSFLDEVFESQYQGEKRMGTIFWIFALLAIFVASLGLFGLSNFMIEQRTKEIGIRKVYGANVPDIMLIFSRQFSSWVLIASFIAVPLGYFIAGKWLENFAYRTPMGIFVFVMAILIALVITLLTISSQALRTARMNPVDSLKYE